VPPGTDPLGADSVLVLACGVLTGTAAPAASRLHIGALSPQTGLIGCSNVGGDVGIRLRSLAIQCVVIRGCASTPVSLLIGQDRVLLRDAAHLWGCDTEETRARLSRELGLPHHSTLVIGPAGENRVRFACIMAGADHAAGRTGMGAVMGAKRLKAIVFDGAAGGRRTPDARAREACRAYVRRIKSSPEFDRFSQLGSAGYVGWSQEKGYLSAYNYRGRDFAAAQRLDGARLLAFVTRRRGCKGCPVQCKAELALPTTDGTARAYRPEFEPMLNLGAKCGLEEIEKVVALDNLCSRLGLDSTSMAGVTAFAMDLWERNILTAEDTDGLTLAWGDGDAMETLIRRVAYRRGLGKLLGEGVRRAAAAIGRGAEAWAVHVKGLELTAYHPLGLLGTALAYAVSNRGGDYSNVYPSLEHRWSAEKAARELGTACAVDSRSPRGKGRLVRRAMLATAVVDCLGLCKVPVLSLGDGFDLEAEAVLTSAISDLEFDAAALLSIGERVVNLERLFNLKHGLQCGDDRLPPLFSDPLYGGREEADPPDGWLETMVADFYRAMGWDALGHPLPATLARLSIDPGSVHLKPCVSNTDSK
jgi:aldehyde:ferredoxin oxidoreductase